MSLKLVESMHVRRVSRINTPWMVSKKMTWHFSHPKDHWSNTFGFRVWNATSGIHWQKLTQLPRSVPSQYMTIFTSSAAPLVVLFSRTSGHYLKPRPCGILDGNMFIVDVFLAELHKKFTSQPVESFVCVVLVTYSSSLAVQLARRSGITWAAVTSLHLRTAHSERIGKLGEFSVYSRKKLVDGRSLCIYYMHNISRFILYHPNAVFDG